MLKICLCSDNHNNRDALSKILNDNPTCDYYFHLGDSGMSQDDLYPFISIKGNNDWLNDFPMQRIVNLNNRKILMIHGNGYTDSYNMLINKTRKEKCDVLFFGHIHEFVDDEYMGIRLINPGSCFYNRDLSNPCYARVYIDTLGNIKCERIDL